MLDQTFSAKGLLRLLSRSDPKRYSLGESKKEYLDELAKIAGAINSPEFSFSRFNLSERPQGTLFTPTHVRDEFALRKMNDNLKRTLGLTFSDRSKIVPQVITLLNEAAPYHVARFDIKRFYESIDRDEVLGRIVSDNRISYRTKDLCRRLFATPELSSIKGLPLGISVSSTLSELYLESFDVFCKRIESVYYYVRYVDDILLFSYEHPQEIEARIARALPGKLQLNAKKAEFFAVDKKGNCGSVSSKKYLTFLGYDFHFNDSPRHSGGRITVCISDKKIKKIKTRIALSLFSYLKKTDYELLKLRISFLSSNYTLANEKATGVLYSGIYYNYRHIENGSKAALVELDDYLRRAIHSKKGSLGKKLSARLSKKQRQELCRYSFLAGFENRVRKNFSHPELREIKSIWSHA